MIFGRTGRRIPAWQMPDFGAGQPTLAAEAQKPGVQKEVDSDCHFPDEDRTSTDDSSGNGFDPRSSAETASPDGEPFPRDASAPRRATSCPSVQKETRPQTPPAGLLLTHPAPKTRVRATRGRRIGMEHIGVPRPGEMGDQAEPSSKDRGQSAGAIHLPATEIDFAELSDGSLVELVEDPKDPTRTLLVVWKDGHLQYWDRLEHSGKVLLPLQRKGEILRRVRLPREAKPYQSVKVLLAEVEGLTSRCVVLPDYYVRALANFVLSTWLVDRLPVAPYISLVGLPQSGKTTLLKVLSLVCRRPLLTADITSAAFYEACARLTPTFLIDETGSHGSNSALRHLLRMGTTRDVVAMRKNQTFHAYGAKVICWLEPPDDMALNSRCILISMTEANDPNLIKPNDPGLEQEAAELQAQLLQFRFDHYKTLQIPTIAGAEALRPRTRDLLACLTAPCVEDEERCTFLLQFFRWQAASTVEPLSPPQSAVLGALFSLAHRRPDDAVVLVADLTCMVNQLLERAYERIRLYPRKVGAVLTSLGFTSRQRTNLGWTVWLDRSERQRVHELAQAHGVEGYKLDLPIPPEECPLCKETKILVRGKDNGKKARYVRFQNNVGFFSAEAEES